MKQYLVLCGLFLSVSGGIFAQGFSISETEAIAEFLYLDNVLSEVGKEELKFRAREEQLPLPHWSAFGTNEKAGMVAPSQILRFLAGVYESGFFYRKGGGIYLDALKARGLGSSTFGLDSLQQQAIRDEYERQLLELPANQLERMFADQRREDLPPLRDTKQLPMGLLLGQARFEDRAMPTSRSAFGYGVLETLSSLRTLKLISESTYGSYLADLRENGLLPDYLLLQELADHASEREILAWRTENRSLALQWLDERSLLVPDAPATVGRDSAFLGAPDQYDLYTLLRGGTTIQLVSPADLEDISQQIASQLCAVDSLFCVLSVKVEVLPPPSDRPGSPQFRITSTYRGKEISRSEAWAAPAGDRDLLSWVGRYPLDVIMAPYNTLLDSLNASYRLYYAFPTEYDGLETRDLLVLPLGSRAARAVAQTTIRRVQGPLAGPDPAGFLTPAESAEWLDSLRTRGFFDSLSEASWTEGKRCVESNRLLGPADFFSCFPSLRVPYRDSLFFDTVGSVNPLAQLSGAYYFVLPPGFGGGGVYLRMEEAAAAYLTKLLGTGIRKL